MRNKLQILFYLSCFFIILFSSCTKNSSADSTDTETQTAEDNSFAEITANDVTSMSTQSEDDGIIGSISDSTAGFLFNAHVKITLDIVSTPKVLTIDFGSTNYLCFDGKNRRGKVIITFSGLYRDSGSTHTITFDNYYVNNYKVEGNVTVTNTGHNTAGNLTFTNKATLNITDTANNTLTYNGDHVREWVAGESTWGIGGWHDDVYSITGSSSGTTFKGVSYTSKITSALIVALNCKWIEKGIIAFTPSGKLTRTIDFGNGDCDNTAVITIAGTSFNITLP